MQKVEELRQYYPGLMPEQGHCWGTAACGQSALWQEKTSWKARKSGRTNPNPLHHLSPYQVILDILSVTHGKNKGILH